MKTFREFLMEGSENQVFNIINKIIKEYGSKENFIVSKHSQIKGGGWEVNIQVDNNKSSIKQLKDFEEYLSKNYSWAGPTTDTRISIRGWWGSI